MTRNLFERQPDGSYRHTHHKPPAGPEGPRTVPLPLGTDLPPVNPEDEAQDPFGQRFADEEGQLPPSGTIWSEISPPENEGSGDEAGEEDPSSTTTASGQQLLFAKEGASEEDAIASASVGATDA